MKKILIIKTSSLGDIIHAYPVISYLHQKFPQAKIDWVVEKHCAELVSTHPFVSKTLCIHTIQWRKAFYQMKTMQEMLSFRKNLREEVYDVIFDLQGNTKSGLVLSQARGLHKVGFTKRLVFEWPNLLFTNCRYDPPPHQNAREECLFLAKSFFQDTAQQEEEKIRLKISDTQFETIKGLLNRSEIQQQLKIIVCPGSAWANKQLTPEALVSFLTLLQNHLGCGFLFLWGSAQEYKFAQELNEKFQNCSVLADKLPLPALQNLMASVNLVIAMDSLPLHLAGTTNTPTFSIFGASSANKYKPKGDQHLAFQGTCPYGRSFERRCPILRTCSTGLCIRGLQGKELFEYFSNQNLFKKS